MYGRHDGLPIAAAFPIMIPGQTVAVQRLIELGHKRIVMLAREERRKPQLSRTEQTIIDQLEAATIPQLMNFCQSAAFRAGSFAFVGTQVLANRIAKRFDLLEFGGADTDQSGCFRDFGECCFRIS